MFSRRPVIFLAIFLASPLGAAAGRVPEGFPETPLSDLLVRQWTLDEGLPTESLTDVLQTRDGFLWIASYEGLFRFDGLRFDVFDKEGIAARTAPGAGVDLAADGFYHLAEDRSGALWVAGPDGQVLRYVDGLFTVFATGIAGPVYGACADASDRLWLGGRSPAYLDLSREPPAVVAVPELEEISITAVACDGETVWMGTDQGRWLELRAGTLGKSAAGDGDAIETLTVAGDGSLWIGSRGGLKRMAGGETRSLAAFRGVGIYRILEDRHGDLWLATTRGLGRRQASGAVDWLAAADSGLSQAHALRFDHEGSLWVAGRRGGLFQLKERKLASLTARDGLPPGSVDALLETRDGEVLIGFDDVLAAVGEEMRPLPRAMPQGLGPFDVLTMLEDLAGDLWIGSYLGLVRIDRDGQGFEWFSQETGFPSSEIRALHQDAAGSLWIGTGNRGVVKRAPDGSFQIRDHMSGLLSDFVFAIDETPDRELLFAVRGGFHVLSPGGELETYRTGQDFPGSNVFSVNPDSKGRLWLCTDGGLVRFDGERFDTFGKAQGLPTEVIFDLREDDQGFLWISSSKGILRLATEALDRHFDGRSTAVEVWHFDEDDGMSNRQCSGARRILETADGRLWFPTHDGVTVADPRHLAFNQHLPPVAIERLLVDGEEISMTPPISLAPGFNRYELEFAVLSYRDPDENRARYTLEGFAEGWTLAEGRRRVAYTSLPPGSYAFHVAGSNDDGLWNETGARLAFEVRPFYYETRTFQIAAVSLFLALVAAVYHWRHRAMRRRHRELKELSDAQEELLAERENLIAELRASNDELERFTYTVSHDLKSPLVTILGFLGFLRQDAAAGKTERIVADVDRIRAAAEKMEQLLEDLLELSRIGRVTEPPQAIAMSELAAEAISQVAGAIADAGAEVDVAAAMPAVTGDRMRLLEVWQNLIENAVKYRRDQVPPRIEVGAADGTGDDGPAFYVRDNGRGIDPRYHDRIFGLFERLDADGEGNGVGLALVKRIVELHGGRVWVESDGHGHGSTFYFTLAPEAAAE